MSSKQRRPDMTARIRPLPECTGCAGSGVEQGLLGKVVCRVCYGAGMTAATGDPLPVEQALLQLRLRLSQAREQLGRGVMSREQASEYYIENDRGPGRSTYAGD